MIGDLTLHVRDQQAAGALVCDLMESDVPAMRVLAMLIDVELDANVPVNLVQIRMRGRDTPLGVARVRSSEPCPALDQVRG